MSRGGAADEQRDHGLGGVVDDERETAEGEAPPVAEEVGKERSEAGEHKSSGLGSRDQGSENEKAAGSWMLAAAGWMELLLGLGRGAGLRLAAVVEWRRPGLARPGWPVWRGQAGAGGTAWAWAARRPGR